MTDFPDLPWKGKSKEEMFKDSLLHGHGVSGYKCQNCGLEFVLLTWRIEEDIQVQLSSLVCPEYGIEGKSIFCGYKRYKGAIFDHMAELIHDEETITDEN